MSGRIGGFFFRAGRFPAGNGKTSRNTAGCHQDMRGGGSVAEEVSASPATGKFPRGCLSGVLPRAGCPSR